MIIVILGMAGADPVSSENSAREQLLSTPITLEGRILYPNGTPSGDAIVSIQGSRNITSRDGWFILPGLARNNSLLSIQAPGYRPEWIPVHLFLPVSQREITIDPVYLTAEDSTQVRFLFGGDTHFGRRYIDPMELTPRNQLPPDNPSALIRVSDPEPGTKQVLRFIRPYFQEADFSGVNLESPVTDNVSTPHPTKDYVLLTLPGSLPAVKWLGVSYVSLGNNHVYDYLDTGLRDTRDSLDSVGIAHSGAGDNTSEAFEAYRVTLKGSPYAFLAMNSIDGSEHAINYVAGEHKAGSANARDSSMVTSSIRRELDAGYIPIVQIHGGDEYVYDTPEYISGRIDLAVDSGAALVVSEHSHIAEGVGIRNGVVVVKGLGNLAFDAERHETMLGLLARADMKGEDVQSLRLIPVYIGNFTPVPVSGNVADLLLRRIGEYSRDSPYPVYPYNGQGWVALGEGQVRTRDRNVSVDVMIPESGSLVLDLRPLAGSHESVLRIRDTVPGTEARMGRDLMLYGDFEDWDVDNFTGETDSWDTTPGSLILSVREPYRGTQSLTSIRGFENNADSVIAFRNRIRVTGDARNQAPNKNLTFLGYVKGIDAGPVTISARYLASEDPIGAAEGMTFGDEDLVRIQGGTFPWQQYVADIHMPPDDPAKPRDPVTDPRALQVFIRHSPSAKSTSIAEFDDFAIISWEETLNLTGDPVLHTPHARDFLLLNGTPGSHELTFTFRSYQPLPQ